VPLALGHSYREIAMQFIHMKGHSPTIVARTAKYQTALGGGFMLEAPAVFVKFSGAIASVDESDPHYDCKVAACRKAKFVVQIGEDPKQKLSVSAGEPVAKSAVLPAGVPASGVSAPSGPPKFSIPTGLTGATQASVPNPTKEDLED